MAKLLSVAGSVPVLVLSVDEFRGLKVCPSDFYVELGGGFLATNAAISVLRVADEISDTPTLGEWVVFGSGVSSVFNTLDSAIMFMGMMDDV